MKWWAWKDSNLRLDDYESLVIKNASGVGKNAHTQMRQRENFPISMDGEDILFAKGPTELLVKAHIVDEQSEFPERRAAPEIESHEILPVDI